MKKIFAFALAVLMALCLGSAALATSEFGYMSDSAYILTDSEAAHIAADAESVSEKHNCGVYVVTVADMYEFGYLDAFEFAQDVYTQFNCGVGSGKNGIILVLSMEDRDYGLAAYGDFANTAFTDYGKDVMSESFCEYFAEDDWYGGFHDFIEKADELLKMAESGTPLDGDIDEGGGGVAGKIAAILIVPSIIAFVVCLIFKAQMKSVREATDANRYVVEKGVDMRVSKDMFTHTTVTRRLIEEPKRTSSGGGTTVNSSGFSGKSGKF